MARLLVHKATPPLHPTDDAVNAVMYHPGHIITILEDGEAFGADDVGPHSAVVELPGALKVDLEFLLTPDMTITKNVVGGSESLITTFKSIRMWKAKSVIDFLATSGATVLKSDVVAFAITNFDKSI